MKHFSGAQKNENNTKRCTMKLSSGKNMLRRIPKVGQCRILRVAAKKTPEAAS